MPHASDEAQFHVVRRTTTLDQVIRSVYPDPGSANAREFRRLNVAVTDAGGRVLQGQLLFLPGGACRSDEAAVVETLTRVNDVIRNRMDWPERRQLATHFRLLDNAARNPRVLKSAAGIVSTVVDVSLSTLSIEVRVVERLLRELEAEYQRSFQRHGRLTGEFYAKRQRIRSALDTRLGRMARMVALGSPLGESTKRTLGVSTKSQILHWKRAGAAAGVHEFESHFANIRRVNHYLRAGGAITLGLDVAFTGYDILEACRAGDRRACYRASLVEGGGLAGRTFGGALGGAAGYSGCSVVFGAPTAATSFLWCGLFAVGLGYFGNEAVGWMGQRGGEVLYSNTYRTVTP